MFDKEKASSIVPALGKLFDTTIEVGNYTYYPVIQSAVFFTFNALCIGVFYLLYGLSNIKRKEIFIENNID